MILFDTLALIGVNVFWQSALLAFVVYCALALLPRNQISIRYRVALGGMFATVLLLALPFLPVFSFSANIGISPRTTPFPFAIITPVPPVELLPSLPASMAEIPNPASVYLPITLVLIWVFGVLIAGYRLILAARQTRDLRRRLRPAHLRGQGNLSRPAHIMRSPDIAAPLVFGLFSPTIVVPTDFDLDVSKTETRIVLEHEIAHIARGDLWMNLAQKTVLVFMWWCLPLYWINRQICAERENLCDAQATAHIAKTSPNIKHPARALANALVRFAEQRSNKPTPELAIGIHPRARQLAQRVQRLCDTRPVPRLSKKLWLSSSLTIPLTLVMLSTITPRIVAAHPPPKPTSPLVSEQTHNNKQTSTAIKNAENESNQTTITNLQIVTGRLTSKYGLVRKRVDGKMHKGIDIANKIGTPIYTPGAALIIQATDIYKNNPKWGKVVVIETKGGVRTVFAHLDGYSVTKGQTIKAGTQIGKMGNTGESTGPHVHIGTLVDGQYVDPLTVWPDLANTR